MDKKDIIYLLEEMARCLELLEESPFKFAAYKKAAAYLERSTDNVIELIHARQLDVLPGFGKAITEKVYSFYETGKSEYLEQLKSQLPSGLFDILSIRGLGVKKTLELWHKLDITNLSELEYGCNENRLVSLPGFGKKTQDNVLNEIRKKKEYSCYFLYSEGMIEARRIADEFNKMPEIQQFELVGDLRRAMPIADNIVFVVKKSGNRPIRTPQGIYNLTIIESQPEEFYYNVFFHTGSSEHVLSAHFPADNYSSEKEIYSCSHRDYIEPELRENRGELEAASQRKLPALIQKNDIRGIIHSHSTYSDGANSIEEMALECIRIGYEYLALSDHSQSAVYAGGLKPDAVFRQKEEINALNKKLSPFKIFHGIESDILVTGQLDYPDEILAQLDFVIASVHSHFKMSEKEMTERIIRAVNNPYTVILGHLTGRLLLGREPYPLNIKKVVEECIRNQVVIEINSNPHRLDMDWKYIKEAAEEGALFSINPDAHSLKGILDLQYGIITARKGWLENRHVINTMNCIQISDFLQKRRIHE